MKTPLPSCKNCMHLLRIGGEWVCSSDHNERWDEEGNHFKRINRRHSRSVARKCPEYRYWRDAFENMRCIVIAEKRKELE